MTQQTAANERDLPGEAEAWERLHALIDRVTPEIAELLRAWAQLPEITPEASYWVRKAGPEHYAEHLPRLEAWLDELTRRG